MTRFREKQFSFLSPKKNMIRDIEKRLISLGETDFEITNKILDDVITLEPGNQEKNTIIYIPEDLEYSQYKIDNAIRRISPIARTSVSRDRDIYIMRVNGSLTESQIVKLVQEIIKVEEYCALLEK